MPKAREIFNSDLADKCPDDKKQGRKESLAILNPEVGYTDSGTCRFSARVRILADDLEGRSPQGISLGVILIGAEAVWRSVELRCESVGGDGSFLDWTQVHCDIPIVFLIQNSKTAFLIDVVNEGNYWLHEIDYVAPTGIIHCATFSSSRAEVEAEANRFIVVSPPSLSITIDPLENLGGVSFFRSRFYTVDTVSLRERIVFDVSDLLNYFENARLPTGIQRVQTQVLLSIIADPALCSCIKIVFFSPLIDAWVEVPVLTFNHFGHMSLKSGDVGDEDWKDVQSHIHHLGEGKRYNFVRNSFVINLGTSWWLRNYFLHIREAKKHFGIRYLPFVHDLIPVMMPEHCTERLTQDFIAWILGAFDHADFFFANSKATSRDLAHAAEFLSQPTPAIEVVHLDAKFADDGQPEVSAADTSEPIASLLKTEYALLVSTVESRKNHLLAFKVWLRLIKMRGARQIPRLICVGNRGWLNDAVYGLLNASEHLKSHVVMLERVSDRDLRLLYQNAAFTVYPSSYEGWGLPVTESLCFGKVPILSRSSSLPEAGGVYGEYFDLDSERSFEDAVTKLSFDLDYRRQKEELIRSAHMPRSWHDVALQLVHSVLKLDRRLLPLPYRPPKAQLGKIIFIADPESKGLRRSMKTNEVYRQGPGWWWPEPWGCWTKPGGAELAFSLELHETEDLLLYLILHGQQGKVSSASVEVEGVAKKTVIVPADSQRVVILSVPKRALDLRDGSADIVVRISSDQSVDFKDRTKGVDSRIASIGVRGFMVCKASDTMARLSAIEYLSLGDAAELQVEHDPCEIWEYSNGTQLATLRPLYALSGGIES